ncbi:FMRFamide receptor [Biomphalaria glabrata]|nr:FMRFamide receptor-like [Biomphalaria glabrata]
MNVTTPQVKQLYFDPIILDVFMVLCNLVLGELIGLVGLAANVITIIIFCKNGIQDSVDVTLTALAVSDMGSLITTQFWNVIVNPWTLTVRFPFETFEVVTLVSFFPHGYFVKVSGLITSFAAFERCLCVVLPMKVKNIISCRNSLFINVIIFILAISDIATPYYFLYFGWVFSPERNSTLLRVITKDDFAIPISYSYFYSDVFVPYFTFTVLISCTIIIAVSLKRNAKWRSSVSLEKTDKAAKKATLKELKVVRMLTVVSVIFIVCLIPLSATTTAVALVNELSILGPYFNVARLCYCVSFLTETVSSTMNPFVYYKMSSKYKKGFSQLFSRCH